MEHQKKLLIKIDSRCKLDPHKAILSLTGHNQVHWQTDNDKAFALLLPGGVFDGHPNTFALAVSGSDPAPDPPLKLTANPAKLKVVNYVYENGKNCIEADSDDPPDIVIDS